MMLHMCSKSLVDVFWWEQYFNRRNATVSERASLLCRVNELKILMFCNTDLGI